jgi:hypothetical protein
MLLRRQKRDLQPFHMVPDGSHELTTDAYKAKPAQQPLRLQELATNAPNVELPGHAMPRGDTPKTLAELG